MPHLSKVNYISSGEVEFACHFLLPYTVDADDFCILYSGLLSIKTITKHAQLYSRWYIIEVYLPVLEYLTTY